VDQGEVDAYVDAYLARGYTLDQVRQGLMNAGVPAAQAYAHPKLQNPSGSYYAAYAAGYGGYGGYSEYGYGQQAAAAGDGEDVSVPAEEAAPPPGEPEVGGHGMLVPVVLVIVLLVAAGGGYWYVQGGAAPVATPTVEPMVSATLAPTTTPTATPAPLGTPLPTPTPRPTFGPVTTDTASPTPRAPREYCDYTDMAVITMAHDKSGVPLEPVPGEEAVAQLYAQGRVQKFYMQGGVVNQYVVDGKDSSQAGAALAGLVFVEACGATTLAFYDTLAEGGGGVMAPDFNADDRWFERKGFTAEDVTWTRCRLGVVGDASYVVWETRRHAPSLDESGPDSLEVRFEELWRDTGFVKKVITVDGPAGTIVDIATSIDDLVASPPQGASVAVREFGYLFGNGDRLGRVETR
jgi:hypothetical protein